jgi:hypothetical protein
VLEPDFDPAPVGVRIYRCGYDSACKARGCPTSATIVAEKVDKRRPSRAPGRAMRAPRPDRRRA